MEVFKSKFMTCDVDSDNRIYNVKWTIETEKASVNEFEQWNIELTNIYARYCYESMLANTKDYKFVILPEQQEWSVANVFEKFASAGLKKIALVVADDIFPQVSLEQFVNEYGKEKITTKYFSSEEEARIWLLN